MPSLELLRSMFDYHADGGLIRKGTMGNQRSGTVTFGYDKGNGYKRIEIGSRPFFLHRIIWKWHNGSEPEFLDHIDNDPSNNRIENIRPIAQKNNTRKCLKHSHNTTGFIGVSVARGDSFRVVISVNRKQIFIGYYKDIKAAAKASNAAIIKYHGEYGRVKVDQNISEMKRRGWI